MPVGSLMLTREWSDWNNQWYWWIQSVYVTPEHRRQSIRRCIRR
ncbi:MAG: GNAT family N-acetyltransferase [Bacteroidaceae bacterium]|nr:GNAT family N-acetyltransferase [Bacteroidaceae bacterium]